MLIELLRKLGRGLRRAVTALLALLILFEEWGWEPLQRQVARLARLPLWRGLEQRIAALPPSAALVVYLVPVLLLLPVKLLALWLIGLGHWLLGGGVVLAAKLVGTALAARLFTLTRPALLQLPWFARLYARWTAWKETLLAGVRASWAWRTGRALKRLLRQRLARWLRP